MDQNRKNFLDIKFIRTSTENRFKPEEKDHVKKKGEKTDSEPKKRMNRLKEKRVKKLSSSLETTSGVQNTTPRTNQLPKSPHCPSRKNQMRGVSPKRRKSTPGKTADKVRMENPEKATTIGKSEEITRQTGVKASENSFDKTLGFYREKIEFSVDRRRDLLHTVPMTKAEFTKQILPELNHYGNTNGQSNPNQEKFKKQPSVQCLTSSAPLTKDSFFNLKSSPWQKQQKTTSDFQVMETDFSKANINRILKGHAQKMSAHSFKLTATNDVTELVSKTRMIGDEAITKSNADHTKKSGQKVIEIQVGIDNKKSEESDEKKGEKEGREESKDGKTASKNLEKQFLGDSVLLQGRDQGKKDVEKQDAANQDAKRKGAEKSDTEKEDTVNKEVQEKYLKKGIDKMDEDSLRKEKTVTEKAEVSKRVTYTDRLLMDKYGKDLPDKVNSSRAIIASVIEKLHSPFKDEIQKKMEIYLKSGDSKKRSDDMAKPEVRVSSDAELRSTKQRSAREATIVDQVNKTVEQLSKAKCAKSSELRNIVAQAIKEHKIFCIFDNHWYIVRPVREELLSRGWLEVIPDKRLIPRRRPPPAGPTADRNSTTDYAAEAILTAKEAIVDDYADVMTKFPPSRIIADKPKPQRKLSEESLRENNSEFRIVPPTSEKQKTNQEIRDFVGKCQYFMMRKQNFRQGKDKKGKPAARKSPLNGKVSPEEDMMSSCPSPLPSLDDVIRSVEENRKFLPQLPDLEKAREKQEEEAATPRQTAPTEEVVKASKILSENDAKIASKIIQSSNARIHFMWLSIKPAIHLKCFNYSPEIVNKFQRTTFCTKIGLWSHLNNIQWYAHEVNFPAKSPRMYNTGEAEDLQAFFQDFQMTACIGILKWLSETFFDRGIKGVQRKKGKVPIKAFEFAIRQCERYIRFRENEDLNLLEDPKVMQDEWNTFLQWFYIITNDHGKVQETSNAQLMVVYTRAVEVLRAMKRHWPEIDVDGRLNIWIMKPYCASCGRGIFMTNNVYYIGQHSKYIVQKYIERPLLIYNTKFDIRQWFMITKLVPLEVWMYKECYLRFCTQPFVLRNLHESVHLSNNSVQRKYLNQKDAELPDQNMWDSNTFQQYLKTIGQPNAWNEVIYPGMRDAIISLMLAAQDTFDNQRRSWFEVYGADFMISANPKDGPWLIEINESPAMDPSTKVTAKLCPQMLRDVIKVVVDKRANKNALTGQWELVYRQNYSPSYGNISIDVKGKRIAKLQQNKTGYSNNWAPSPPIYNQNRVTRNISPERENLKKYEILKSYTPTKKAADVNLKATKSSIWGNRVKGRLITEAINPYLESSKVCKKNMAARKLNYLNHLNGHFVSKQVEVSGKTKVKSATMGETLVDKISVSSKNGEIIRPSRVTR